MPKPSDPALDDLDDLVDVTVAAPLLGLAPKTLNNLRQTGGGPDFYRIGRGRGAIRYSRRELAAYRESRRRRSTSETGASP